MQIIASTLVSSRTREGLVNLEFIDDAGTKVAGQLTLAKAREVRDNIAGAIEAAVSDELIVKFLTTKIGLTDTAAAAALLDFRELRQGSRTVVFPS